MGNETLHIVAKGGETFMPVAQAGTFDPDQSTENPEIPHDLVERLQMSMHLFQALENHSDGP